MTRTEFLSQRLDEDEAAARAGGTIFGPVPNARGLADVDAKRRIVALHSAEPGQHPDFCGHDLRELPCPTLRLLALPYADHEDFQEEWR